MEGIYEGVYEVENVVQTVPLLTTPDYGQLDADIRVVGCLRNGDKIRLTGKRVQEKTLGGDLWLECANVRVFEWLTQRTLLWFNLRGTAISLKPVQEGGGPILDAQRAAILNQMQEKVERIVEDTNALVSLASQFGDVRE